MDLKSKINQYIETMNTYFKNNMLQNNLNKTQFMIFSTERNLNETKIQLCSKNIENSSHLKILGTHLSSNLNWNFQITQSQNSMLTNIKKAGIIKSISWKTGKKFACRLMSLISINNCEVNCAVSLLEHYCQ